MWKSAGFVVIVCLLVLCAAPETALPNDQPAQASPGSASDQFWDDSFAPPGLGGLATAVAVSGADVYVGGLFSVAGNVQASNIARWNGSSWSVLGSGADDLVRVLAVSGGDLYAGGDFTRVGEGIAANHIAKWDGNTWSALGEGVGDSAQGESVSAVAVSGSAVYAAGGLTRGFVAKWDGAAWSALGTPPGVASAIAVVGSDIYISVGALFKWNGTNWELVGGGLSGTSGLAYINSMAVAGTDIYIAGSFNKVGDLPATNVAKWDGRNWSAFGSGVAAVALNGIAVSGGSVYVGGEANLIFPFFGFSALAARWDGSSWSTLGTGSPNDTAVRAVAAAGADVYFGGAFDSLGRVNAFCVAKWREGAWSSLGDGNGVDSSIFALLRGGNSIYAAGIFVGAGRSTTANNIARWDGTNWSPLGSGIPNATDVEALARIGNDIYAGGDFAKQDGSFANAIARWDGSNWSELGNGLFGSFRSSGSEIRAKQGSATAIVSGMAVSGNNLYVAGPFASAGGQSAIGVARWDGQNWFSVGGGLSGFTETADHNPNPTTIAASGTDVYVGGAFTKAGGVDVSNIAKWDGTNWSPLGSGTNSTVTAIAVNGSDVYVGGFFTKAGGLTVNHIARWDGGNWFPLGSGVAGGAFTAVHAIAVKDSNVYVGGEFDTAGGVTVNNIAKWDGSNWFPLGSGIGGGVRRQSFHPEVFSRTNVRAIALSGSDIYIGGNFTTAGGKVSARFAHWSIAGRGPTLDSAAFNGAKLLTIRGNNFTSSIHVTINGVDRTDFVRAITGSSIRIKGKASALGLLPGDNSLQVSTPGGASSNVLILTI